MARVKQTTRKRKPSLPRQRRGKGTTKKGRKKNAGGANPEFAQDGLALIIGFIALFLALALYSHQGISSYQKIESAQQNLMGLVGERAADFLYQWLGWTSWGVVPLLFLLAYGLWQSSQSTSKDPDNALTLSFLASLSMVFTGASFLAVGVDYMAGGRLGTLFAVKLTPYLNDAGVLLVSAAAFIISLGILTRTKLEQVFAFTGKISRWSGEILADIFYFIHGAAALLSGGVVSCLQWFFSGFRDGLGKERSEIAWKPGLPKLGSARLDSVQSLTKQKKASADSRGRGRGAKDSEEDFSFYVLDEDSNSADPRDSNLVECDLSLEVDLDNEFSGEGKHSQVLPEIKISRQIEEGNPKKKSFFGRLKKSESEQGEAGFKRPARDYGDFVLPATDMLVGGERGTTAGPKDKELFANSKKLEQALKDFRIGGKVVEVHPGPVITLYEFLPAAGVKVQRIVNLSDDLALSLKVGRVRVYAPVPGKGTVGIEVPNTERQIVRLRDVLESDEVWNPDVPLELALGKDTFGDPQVTDLAKMPHLLIAGTTGTGKSVCINSILMSLLYRNAPDELRLLLIDPKMLELTVYEGIPHLKAPVVTNPKHARGLLHWAVEEMERRYRLMMKLGVRSLESYNKAMSSSSALAKKKNKRAGAEVIELEEQNIIATATEEGGVDRSKHGDEDEIKLEVDTVVEEGEPLPRIVIVVDELADLMLTVGREIEELLTRLAQKARAAGIHLILATQRPSVNVITGLIKANFPSRISFQVATKIDSRTIIDQSGAEKLLGQGDMLFLPPGTGRLRRLHSPFVSDGEVQSVVEYIRSQGEPDYDPEVTKVIERLNLKEEGGEGEFGEDEEFDQLYDRAVQLVIDKGQASTSMVQRAFRIGYNRAARILDSMESQGVVGPADGARPRQVMVPKHETL